MFAHIRQGVGIAMDGGIMFVISCTRVDYHRGNIR